MLLNHFFSSRELLKESNSTTIALVPKIPILKELGIIGLYLAATQSISVFPRSWQIG